jgi:acetyl-CoA C-acetyltransferase
VRTPRGKGKPNGALHRVHPQELLASSLVALQDRVGFEPADVDDVVTGNLAQVGEHGADIARLAVLAAGWPIDTPGVVLNRFCGSGQQAVTFGAMGIMSGQQDVVIAAGVESMSRWPVNDGAVDLLDGGNPNLRRRYPLVPQGISADLIATLEKISRGDVDEYAALSQARCEAAVADGRFDRSLFAVRGPDGSVLLDRDEHPRKGTSAASLAGLPAAFEALGTSVLPGFTESFDGMCERVYPGIGAIDHVHTAGNSSGIVDGAAALLLCSESYAHAQGIAPRGRIVQTAVRGSEPVIMLTGPTPASRTCLQKAGMSVKDIDLWEINEAFAAVSLKVVRDLDLDLDRVNVNGGAIALGHPIGATGVMLIQTALDELERRDLNLALVTMCTGGGMATATIVERLR